MPESRKFLTADERLQELQRDRKALRRERMIREVAGPVWHRMVKVVPLSFEGQGRLVARELLGSREAVIEVLRPDAVFAVDTAMRLAHGAGFLASREVQAYLAEAEPLDRLVAAGLISADAYPFSCAPGRGHPACWPAWWTSSLRRARCKAASAS